MAIDTLPWTTTPPEACRHSAVAIGNFDGVHRGHAALIHELRTQARAVGGPAVVLTFDPPPLKLLRPEHLLPPLTTLPDRAALLHEQGAERVLILETTVELLHLTAAEFFTQVVRTRLGARAMVEGANFGFGRDREGDVAMLAGFCRAAGMPLVIVPPVEMDGRAVSSSRVRDALGRGAVREAALLLGRPYRLRGLVGRGQQRGQTLGFPTANLERVATFQPAEGVYAVRVTWQDRTWPGAANLGPNPTFGEHERKLEVHLIGFQGDLAGQSLAVDFIERLRDTRPFAGVGELVQQLHADVEQARQLVAATI